MPRSEYSQAERVGEQIVRLIAMFAMHLMSTERERLKLFSFDEGWRLLGDPVGRTLLASLQRMGRSELAVPIISTQLVTDTLVGERESLENLLGATFVFGMRSEAEAARALSLLGLDPEDRRMRQACSSSTPAAACSATTAGGWRRSRSTSSCPSLLRAFSTTPAGQRDGAGRCWRSRRSLLAFAAMLAPAPSAIRRRSPAPMRRERPRARRLAACRGRGRAPAPRGRPAIRR